ncbi:MAG: transposase, partial [Ruminococcus sp.]|nr:transposase [Ruminococcus sp.]
MGRRKRERMSEGKKNIIGMLLEEYDIQSAKDIEDALKDLLGGTIQEMLESEMDEYLGYNAYKRSDNPDYRNGNKTKKIRGNFGETEIEVSQDRNGTFEPKIVKKRQKDISGVEQKIISLYAKGMTTSQISEIIEDIYGFEVSDGFVSDVTDRLLPQIEDWQKRPLDDVYPIVFIDAVHFSVRDNGQIKKLAAYVILAISLT